ncbi:MAG TPA: prepilin-type N-terminal cleavage/methylation domain-containing protein [Chlamydiales bacterium]|nr:MAG: hypothetical protein A3F67_11110 [Verrucomicrobia bacterium RIFCSPHIGHO2_12_FULL_41_10]HLB53111.1 prepilin-type N-terminal cleavage/methylation domain-containing protein [Chlamydiales bacterium]
MTNIKKIRKNRRPFTLLELLVTFSIIALVSGAVFSSSRTRLARSTFLSDVSRLSSHINALQKIAVNTQADWRGELFRKEGAWVFVAKCVDPGEVTKVRTLKLHSFDVLDNGKEIDKINFEFFSSGEVRPVGPLFLRLKEDIKTVKLMQREEGDGKKQLGPLHPLLDFD